MRGRRELHAELADVLAGDPAPEINGTGLALHYQPIVELATAEVRGFEALIRWRHPSYGLIPASELIEVAEQTGLILPLGEWVLQRAFSDVAALGSRQSTPAYVSVNVSASQLLAPGFADNVLHHIAKAGVRPEQVVLEITESQHIQDDERIWRDFGDLRNRGIRIAVDDYGTGYASLSYLRHPVIDMLKLDRTFLAGIEEDRVQTILRSVLALTRSLDIDFVAEGIEDDMTRSMLDALGCEFGQGYLFAAAMPLADARRWSHQAVRESTPLR